MSRLVGSSRTGLPCVIKGKGLQSLRNRNSTAQPLQYCNNISIGRGSYSNKRLQLPAWRQQKHKHTHTHTNKKKKRSTPLAVAAAISAEFQTLRRGTLPGLHQHERTTPHQAELFFARQTPSLIVRIVGLFKSGKHL